MIANPPFGSLQPMRDQFRATVTVADAPFTTQRLDHALLLHGLRQRHPAGRAVFILAAEHPRDHALERPDGGSRYLFNFLADHFEVEAVIGVHGDLYGQHGAHYPVRLVVVGAQGPGFAPVPETVPVVATWDALWRMKNDPNTDSASVPCAWIAVDHGLGTDRRLAPYTLVLKGDRSLYQSIAEDDCVLVLNPTGEIVRAGRVLRLRSDLETTTIFFDRLSVAEVPVPVASISLTPPSAGNVGRIQWDEFVGALSTALHQTVGGVPPVEDRAYVRELLQLAVVDDLLGPAGGPHERIVDMSVRDRYLVGKLAPREAAQGGIEGLDGPLANADAEEPTDPIVPGQHEPGAEFGTATGRVEPESDSSDEIDAASNQSLVPSSLGLTSSPP